MQCMAVVDLKIKNGGVTSPRLVKMGALNIKQGLSFQDRTCSVARQYLLPLKTDYPGVVFVTSDLGGPSNQYGPFSR